VLVVSEQSLGAFRTADLKAAAGQVEKWLCSVDQAFANTIPAERRALVERMVDLAVQDGMESERDIRLFCFGCWRLGPQWHDRLTSGQTGAWLADPQFNAESKLLHIDGLIAEAEAA
jgi:hypothetical protein